MKIAVTEEFLDQMADVPASVAKGCRDVIGELIRSSGDGFRRGMNLEKLKGSDYHSVRINRQYRILLKITGGSYLLCRVGVEDFAYSPTLDRKYSAPVSIEVVRNEGLGQGGLGSCGWDLERIISRLNEQNQRASYGAIAGFLGGGATPRYLTDGRPRNPMNSWVVAAGGKWYGRPSRYEDKDIHAECRRQIRECLGDFIQDTEVHAGWLRAKRS
jgi:hypothetical protein